MTRAKALCPGWILVLMFWSVSFFLHFFWEMIQVPFFEGMTEAPHGAVIWLCTRAAVGDANIAFFAYGVAALAVRNLFWIQGPWRSLALGSFLAAGLLVTVLFETWATGAGERWQYSESMPVLPLLGTGVAPILQWVLIPLVSFYSTRWMYRGWLKKKQ